MKLKNSDIIVTKVGKKYYKYHVNPPFYPMVYYTKGISITEGIKEYKTVYNNYTADGCLVEYWRNPTEWEIKFGEGAIHYKTFHRNYCSKPNGDLKKWIVCFVDGFRYYKCK